MSAETKFVEAVNALAPGNRFGTPMNRAAALGRLSGRSEEEVLDYIMQFAPGATRPDRSQVLDAIGYAGRMEIKSKDEWLAEGRKPPRETEQERRERRRRLLPSSARQFVEKTLVGIGRGSVTAMALGELVRLPDDILGFDEAEYRRQAACQLRAVGGRVWCGDIAKNALPRPWMGNGIADAEDLAARFEAVEGMRVPTHISLNPMSGLPDHARTTGNLSFDCLACISAHRFALLEWDDLKGDDGMPSQEHIDLVAGLVDWAADTGAISIASVTYTGGKSIHVVVRVRTRPPDDTSTDDLGYYVKECRALLDLFASSDDPRYRIDTSRWYTGGNAQCHARLAGAIRPETGRRARLFIAD